MQTQTPRFISSRSDDDDYYLIVVASDPAIVPQLRSLAHLAGGKTLAPNTIRFPYEIICRLAGRQIKARFDDTPDVDNAPWGSHTAEACMSEEADAPTPRRYPCGQSVTGRADNK